MSNSIYHSYFDTITTSRKPPTKRSSPAKKQSDPPKKLSKAFTRQLEKTLSTTKATRKRKSGVAKQTSSAKRKRATTTSASTSRTKMPKRSAAAATEETYDRDGGFVEDAEPKSKKSKTSASTPKSSKTKKNSSASATPTMGKDKDGGVFWSLPNKRRVQLTEFKGKLLVGIREFYEKDGEMLPGKKGISMTLEVFDAVLGVLPELGREVERRGGRIRGVSVEGEKGEEDVGEVDKDAAESGGEGKGEEEAEEVPTKNKTKSKLDKFKHKVKNHEATSDEDEE
ncbi:hypothetical protein BST61_g10336 [Cercospora zeina]